MANANVTLKKLIGGVVTELYPKSTTSQILDPKTQKNLADVLAEVIETLGKKATAEDLTALQTKFNNLVTDAPEALDTLKEIADWIGTHETEYQGLLELSKNKVDKVDGKQLSTEDFTTLLKEKLDALDSKADMDAKITAINDRIDAIVNGGGEGAITADKVSYTNGSITNVKEALDQLLYVAPVVNSLTASVATVQEKGASLSNIKFTWTLNKAVKTQTFDGNSVEVAKKEYTYAGPLTANKSFSLSVSDGTETASKSVSISFQDYIHYGVSDKTENSDVLVDSFVLGLASKKFGTAKSSIGTVSATAGAGQYIYFAIPTAWATALSFKIGGFDTDFVKVGSFEHTNASGYRVSYSVFRSGQPNLGATTMTVI